jgi:hypothetical protein
MTPVSRRRRSSPLRRLTSVVTVALLLELTACGRVLEYPDETPETSASLCSDGEDNDYDGQADCDDSECDGFCHEESSAECSDGRDNDGDGLADEADPRCWLLRPPHAQRCAESSGAEVLETFDGASVGFSSVEAPWYGWDVGATSRTEGDRRDIALGFFGSEVGSVVRQRPFSGSWQDFALSFSASVPPRTMLRAALIPMELAPTTDWPLNGDETRLFAVTVDARRSPATLAIDLEGAHYSVPVEYTASLCGATLCEEDFGRLSVRRTEDGFRAKLVYANGEIAEVRAPPPSSRSVPPVRLVLQGARNQAERLATVDDLVLSVRPEEPCGFGVPQIPGKDCEFSGSLDTFGQSVSVARERNGQYCAFVTASASDPSGGPSVPRAEQVTAWRSPDGKTWSRASSRDVSPIEPPEGAPLIGAAIGSATEGFHAVIIYRTDEGVRLGFADATSCDAWGELIPGPILFADAEAPSYIVNEGRHEIYFTRRVSTGLKLWKIRRGEDARPEELLALPPTVGGPVSVTLAGAKDLVLSYPIAAGSETSGIGLLVGDRTGTSWAKVASDSILELAPRLDTYEGLGQLSFDDRGALSAALAWGADGGFLLYAGTATNGRLAASRYPPLVQVGTARLLPASESFPDDRTAPEPSCGDGICREGESCSSCELDCPCGGVELIEEPLSATNTWHVLSNDPDPAAITYMNTELGALSFGAGEPTWSVLPLEQSVTGDFELSFDLFMPFSGQATDENATGAWPACSIYVGLGTPPQLGSGEPEPEAPNGVGVYAELKLDPTCEETDEYHAAPFAVSAAAAYSGFDRISTCSAEATLRTDAWQHVAIRREGSEITVVTPRGGGCGMTETSVTYAGAMPDLPALLVGFGRGPFEACPRAPTETSLGTAPRTTGTIRNLNLRLLDDPSACPATKTLCGEKREQPSCVDPKTSAEHCGECGQRCDANETCHDGECRCSELPGTLECEGVCVDTLSSREHCGECGRVCPELCIRGTCATSIEGCEETTEIPPTGGAFELELTPDGSVASVCNTPVFAWTFFRWTPSIVPEADGNPALVEVEADNPPLRTVLGVASPSCPNWFACSDDHPSFESGTRARFFADEGATYLIGVGLLDPPRENQTATLTIGLEP